MMQPNSAQFFYWWYQPSNVSFWSCSMKSYLCLFINFTLCLVLEEPVMLNPCSLCVCQCVHSLPVCGHTHGTYVHVYMQHWESQIIIIIIIIIILKIWYRSWIYIYMYALWIQNTRESGPCSYEVTKPVAKKSQKQFLPCSTSNKLLSSVARASSHWYPIEASELFLGFLCNCFSCFITVRITFSYYYYYYYYCCCCCCCCFSLIDSDWPHSCEATKAVAKKAQNKFWGFNGIRASYFFSFFLGFLCNYLSYLQYIYMIYIIYMHII